jgi:hypothetical protein
MQTLGVGSVQGLLWTPSFCRRADSGEEYLQVVFRKEALASRESHVNYVGCEQSQPTGVNV